MSREEEGGQLEHQLSSKPTYRILKSDIMFVVRITTIKTSPPPSLNCMFAKHTHIHTYTQEHKRSEILKQTNLVALRESELR